MRRVPLQSLSFTDFTGGESSVHPLTKMPVKYSVKLQNCHISERGSIYKIPGYAKVNAIGEAETFLSGHEFVKIDGSTQLLAGGGGKIYKCIGGVMTAIKTGLDTTAKVSFTTMGNICIMVNGVDAPMKYDGTTVSALGGSPPATLFRVWTHRGRVWGLERTNKTKASYCALEAPEDWTTVADAGFLDFRYTLGVGEELIDVVTYIDLQVFFFRHTIAIYSGSNPNTGGDYNLVQLIRNTGVIAPDIVEETGSDLGFLYDTGYKSLKQVVTTGSLNFKDASEVIDPTLRSEMVGVGANSFASAHYARLGWLMILINDKVWIYSYVHKAWGRMVGADVKGMFTGRDNKLYLCGTGFLYEYGSGSTFAGANPTVIWETGWRRLSRAGYKVYPKYMEIITYPQAATTINVETRYDQNIVMAENVQSILTQPDAYNIIDNVTDFDAINPFDEVAYNKPRIPLFGGGSAMQHIFTNTSDQPVEISEMLVQAVAGGF